MKDKDLTVQVSQINIRHADKAGRGAFKYAPMSLAVLKAHELFQQRDESLEYQEVVFVDGVHSSRYIPQNKGDRINIPH